MQLMLIASSHLMKKPRQHLFQPRQHLLQLLLPLHRDGQNPARTRLLTLHSSTRGLDGSTCSCHRAATWYWAIGRHRPMSTRLTASFVAHGLIGRRQWATRSRSLVGHVNMRTDNMLVRVKKNVLRAKFFATQPTILSELLSILGAEGCVVDVDPRGPMRWVAKCPEFQPLLAEFP